MSIYPLLLNKFCKFCHTQIIAKRSRDLNKEFCGSACVGKFKGLQVSLTKQCVNCLLSFNTTPSQNLKFCSKQCANKYKIIVHFRNCLQCGKQFQLKNIAYERRGDGLYCSRECSTRIYKFDDNYFSTIDSADKAYWLGILLSDGNVYKNQMTLKLQRRDKDLLLKFKQSLSSEHPIHDGISTEGHPYSIFYIGSKILCSQLREKGIVSNKTYIVKYPSWLDKNLNSHFIRGYFDGDGCISVCARTSTFSIFSMSETFVDELQKILQEETQIIFSKYSIQKGYQLQLSRKSDLKKLRSYLYDNAQCFLRRKFLKFSII